MVVMSAEPPVWERRERIAACSANLSSPAPLVQAPYNHSTLANTNPVSRVQRSPALAWLLASGVLLGTEPIERQLRRFSAAGSANLWEQEDELFWRAAFRDAALHPACHRLGGGCAVLDVGAAFGYYSLLTKLWAPAGVVAHAFNPHPAFMHEMRKNLLLNRLDGHVCLHELAARP